MMSKYGVVSLCKLSLFDQLEKIFKVFFFTKF